MGQKLGDHGLQMARQEFETPALWGASGLMGCTGVTGARTEDGETQVESIGLLGFVVLSQHLSLS